jgi:hypothetical protein
MPTFNQAISQIKHLFHFKKCKPNHTKCTFLAFCSAISSVIFPKLKHKISPRTLCGSHKFQNARKARTGRNMVKSSSPNAPSTWHIILFPCTHAAPPKLPPFLLLAFSLLALVAAFSQCLCSENPYLSIKLYRIYVCYTTITLYIAFGIIRGFT